MDAQIIIYILGGCLGVVILFFISGLPLYLIRKRGQNEKATSGHLWFTLANENKVNQHALVPRAVNTQGVGVVAYPDENTEYMYDSSNIIMDAWPPGGGPFSRFTRVPIAHVYATEGQAHCHNFYQNGSVDAAALMSLEIGKQVTVSERMIEILSLGFLTGKQLHTLRTEQSTDQLAGHIKWDSRDMRALENVLRSTVTRGQLFIGLGIVGLLALVSIIATVVVGQQGN